MDKIYTNPLLNIISSLHKHELLRSQKLLETSRNVCTVAFLFSKHALINKGLSAQSVSPPLPPSDFAFIKWRGKVSLLSLPPLPFLWLKHRKVPDFILHKCINHSCVILKCSGMLCWGCHNPPKWPGVHFMPAWTACVPAGIGAGHCSQGARSSRAVMFRNLGSAERARRSQEERGRGEGNEGDVVVAKRSCPLSGSAAHPSLCRGAPRVCCWPPPHDGGMGSTWWPRWPWALELREHLEGAPLQPFPAQERTAGAWLGNGTCGLLWWGAEPCLCAE